MRIGFMATAVMTATLGTSAFAAHQVGMNILSLSFSFGDGMQAAAVALIGQSLGEKMWRRRSSTAPSASAWGTPFPCAWRSFT